MFDNVSNWGWVAAAWIQLVIAYVGYMFYINWRQKRLKDDDS